MLGIGNLVMGDEGIGVLAARRLEEEGAPPGVAVVDGGTGGFHLLSYFAEHDPIVLIDAALDGKPPGTVSAIEPRFLSDFPRSLTAHDIGLRDMIESAALLGPLPKMYLVTISVADLQPVGVIVTPEVEAAIPEALRAARRCLAPHLPVGRRERTHVPPLTVRHLFAAAPPARVFDAWLDPAVAGRWLFATPGGHNVRCEIDARRGGTFVITDRRAGEDVEHRGTYLEIERPRRLAFTFSVPKYSTVETTVTVAIAPAGAGCELTLVHEDVLPEWAASTEQGWRDLLARLDGLLRG